MKCSCGKELTDFDVCPVPTGRPCKGRFDVIRPSSYDIQGLILPAYTNANGVLLVGPVIFGYYR